MKVLILFFCVISFLLSCGGASESVLPPEATTPSSIVPTDTQETVVTPSASIEPDSDTLTEEEQQALESRAIADSLAHDYLLHLLGSLYSLSDLEFSDASLDPDDTMGPNTLVMDDMYFTYSESEHTATLHLFGSLTYDGSDYDFGISTANPLIFSTTEFVTIKSVVTGQISGDSPTSNYVHALDIEVTYLDTDEDSIFPPTFDGSISSTVTPHAEGQDAVDYLIDFDNDIFIQEIDDDIVTHNIQRFYDGV